MKDAQRLVTIMMPFEKYEGLKKISRAEDLSISTLIRNGIDLVLKDSSCKCEDAKDDNR